ncbi:MAG TPA: undecaprenyl-diphosphatase UppP [Limnochordia bacterium]|nr:undecaprenyl-diphosphatase UppP [Limnochordia bacterium]
MTTIQAIVLGVIQGLTEFLPVSSSGHLVLFSRLFNVQQSSLVFEVMVHVGTLLAVLVVFRREVWLLIRSFFRLLRNPRDAKNQMKHDPGCRLLVALIVGTVPTVIAALVLRNQIEELFSSSLFVGFMLLVTGTILYVTERHKTTTKPLDKISLRDGILIGLGQAVAMLPGISRSGTTIAAGLFRGLDRESAARFSFLLAIPAILGALVLSIGDLFSGTAQIGLGILGAGFIAAALTGYLAIHFLLDLVKRGKLVWFSYYTWIVGALVIILHVVS